MIRRNPSSTRHITYLDIPVDFFILLAGEGRQEIWFWMPLVFVYGAGLPYA